MGAIAAPFTRREAEAVEDAFWNALAGRTLAETRAHLARLGGVLLETPVSADEKKWTAFAPCGPTLVLSSQRETAWSLLRMARGPRPPAPAGWHAVSRLSVGDSAAYMASLGDA